MVSRITALITALVVLAALPAPASAADRSFTKRFGVNDLGDIGVIGNTLMTCPGACAAEGGVTGSLNNNDNAMVRVDVDADATTFDSSSATLTMPAGAEVLWAGLYWGADTSPGSSGSAAPSAVDADKVKLGTPAASGYTAVTAGQLDVIGTRYQGFADVTSEVRAGGNGSYRVANVQSGTGNDRYAGWGLVVAYHDDGGLPRNLTVFDGFKVVNGGNPNLTIPVSGFTTAPSGAVNSTLGAISYEGDLASVGDGMQLDAHAITDAVNPANNVFNSTVANRGTRVGTGRSPNQVNHFGFDADTFDADGLLANGATSATINLSTGGETYFPGMLSFASELLAPRIRTTTTVTDLNGGSAEPGDVLEYVISGSNTGNDTGDGVSMHTLIPADLDWVAGSLELTSGAGAGPYTDAAGDDRATWDAPARTVTWRLGTGATVGTGGSLAPGGSFSARFRVRVGVPANGAELTAPARTSYTGNGTGDAYELTGTVASGMTASVPAPDPQPLTTTGVGTMVQSTDLHKPYLGSVRLLDGGSPVTSRTIAGQGTYTLDTGTGVVSFTPEPGYHGTATAVGYRQTDRDGRSASSTYTPTVTLPAPPAAPAETSTGVATAEQTVTLGTPPGGRVRLLSGGTEATTLTVPDQGTYTLDPATGIVTFAPVLGFHGAATAVAYRVTDGYGQTTDATYAATVTLPAPPVAADESSFGVGTVPQSVPLSIPTGGRVRLLRGGAEVTTVTVAGQGTYVLDPASGEVSFTPVLGFTGTPTPVDFRVTNAYGQTDDGVYTPAVAAPLAPTATEQSSVGAQTETQVRVISLPAGGSLTLLDATGASVSEVRVAGQGVYRLDAVAGTITFTPEPGFSGTPAPVTYQVTDAYGHQVSSRYQPVVVASAAASAEPVAANAPQPTPAAAPVAGAVVPAAGCISRRTMTINWLVPATMRLRTIRVSLNGVRTATLPSSVRQVTVDLKGRARSTVVVRVRATTTAGRTVGTTRTYRTCTRKAVRPPLNTLRLLPARR